MQNYESTYNKNPSISVIESILNSRIDQLIALTLPSDKHRHEILETIKMTYSISHRLSSFCDYMIDYIETLSSKLDKTKNELHENKHHSTKLSKNIKVTDKHSSKRHRQSKHDKKFTEANYEFKDINFNVDSNVNNNDLEITPNVECLNNSSLNSNNKQPIKKDDYLSSLKLLNAQEGQLSVSVNDLIHQNLRLQRLHNQDRAILLKQHAVIHGLDCPDEKRNFSFKCDDNNNESSTDSDYYVKTITRKKKTFSDSCSDNEDGILEECKQLKNDFQQISNEIQDLNTQVQRRYHYSRKKCRHH